MEPGHTTPRLDRDLHVDVYLAMMMMTMLGRWRDVMAALGIDEKYAWWSLVQGGSVYVGRGCLK